MARTRRTVLVTALSAAMAISVLAGPAAQAQGGPFCVILSAAEVSAAVGAEIAPNYGDDRSCNYASTAQDVFTFLNVTNGGTRMEIAKSIFEDGADVTVAGQPGWLKTGGFDSYLWIDRGDGDTLSFQLLSPPEGVDAKAALEGLGALAFPRLATLAIPTPTPTPAPTPIVQQDPELAARFPTEIGGTPVQVQTITEGLTMEPEAQAQVEQLLATQGKTLSDLSFGFAFSMAPPYGIYALRLKGADASAFRDAFIEMSNMDGTPTPAQIGGKDVLVATIDGQTQHVYTKDDAIWQVTAEEPVLTEILQKLP
ncbi:MAG: hypothetical protein ABWZ82_03220 [Candidatus Limnocylindrales bacterium]